jgi:serine/threonine protein kinase
VKPSRVVIAGRFSLETSLGAGASATVWRAEDLREGGYVAVKLFAANDPRAARIAREATALARVKHPGLPSLLASGTLDDGAVFLAMEMKDGEPLRARMGARMTDDAVLALGLAVCEPLASLHAAGLVHRDVKPEHIVLDPSLGLARVSLVDLGLAHEASDPRALTADGVVGTLGYLPPEQLASPPAPVDPRWDVFSLGCVLFECATGRGPFAAPDPRGVLARTVAGPAADPRGLAPTMDASLAAAVRAMLSTRPDDRPADASRVRERLASIALRSTADAGHGFIAVILGHPREPERAGLGSTTPLMIEPATVESAIDPSVIPKGARARRLHDESSLVWLASERMDQRLATRALQCALLLAERSAEQRWSVALSEGDPSGPWPRGPALDRALAMRERTQPGEVSTDALTALVAGDAFRFERRGEIFVMRAGQSR